MKHAAILIFALAFVAIFYQPIADAITQLSSSASATIGLIGVGIFGGIVLAVVGFNLGSERRQERPLILHEVIYVPAPEPERPRLRLVQPAAWDYDAEFVELPQDERKAA